MEFHLFEDQIIEYKDLSASPLLKGTYDHCQFSHCDFSETDFSSFRFIECIFKDCNLSLAKVQQTAFRDVRFVDCKMLGLHFNTANALGFEIYCEKSILNNCVFYGWNLKKIVFRECLLKEVDFAKCDLTLAIFDQCDLLDALFEETKLEKADFRTAFNYSIDPENNLLKKAKFSLPAVTGLLHRYNIIIE